MEMASCGFIYMTPAKLWLLGLGQISFPHRSLSRGCPSLPPLETFPQLKGKSWIFSDWRFFIGDFESYWSGPSPGTRLPREIIDNTAHSIMRVFKSLLHSKVVVLQT